MDRERDEADPSPGEQPRRRQVPVSEEDRDRIERHLERMPLERDALLLAMRQFGADFDRDAWQTAYEAFSAEEHNRVVQVTGNLRALVDNAVELVRFAATLTGLRPAGRRPSLLKLLPSFTASYVQWLAEYGVELS